MKKYLLTTLLIISLVGFMVFAVDATDNFTLSTTIGATNLMKVTTAAIGANTLTAYNGLTDFTNFPVTAANLDTGNPIAYLTTLTNNRLGYSIAVKVLAMESTAADYYINYTLYVGPSLSVTTDDDDEVTANTTIDENTFSALTGNSYAIKVKIDADDFNAAPNDTYTGTVTFNYTAT